MTCLPLSVLKAKQKRFGEGKKINKLFASIELNFDGEKIVNNN
jgi:hypothetical protein